MEAVLKLKSVLCDPEGMACIQGSAADRAIIDSALSEIEAENAALKEQVAQLQTIIQEEANDSGNVILELATLQSKSAALVDALDFLGNNLGEYALAMPNQQMADVLSNYADAAFAALAAFKEEK